jgi:hypothetical protein
MATQYANGVVDTRPGEDPVREINGMPLRWGDPHSLVHAVEGANLVPTDFCLWTICELHDVPANCGVRSRAKVTCPHCLEKLAEEAHDNSQFGVGA